MTRNATRAAGPQADGPQADGPPADGPLAEGSRVPRRKRGRPRGNPSPSARDSLLDSAEAIMLENGYAAVSTRLVAARAGTDKALVHYYFATMDDLFIAVFRRNAERGAGRLDRALTSAQPLWALWDLLRDRSSTDLMIEFIALANHRKTVKAVMAQNSQNFRRMQLDGLATALGDYGLDPRAWPSAAVVVLLSAVARYLRTDESFGVGLGHEETVALVERHLHDLEGPHRAALLSGDDRRGLTTTDPSEVTGASPFADAARSIRR